MSDPVLLFRAAGVRLGVSVADVSRLLVEEQLLPVPFSHPAMVGLLDAGPDGPVPVFDLRGLIDPSTIARRARGATVALFPTEQGPVGLRLEALHGTAAAYQSLAEPIATPHAIARTIAGAAIADGEPFSFFAPEEFLAAIGL